MQLLIFSKIIGYYSQTVIIYSLIKCLVTILHMKTRHKDQRSRITMNLTAYDDVSGAHYVDGMHVTRRFILCFMLAVNV